MWSCKPNEGQESPTTLNLKKAEVKTPAVDKKKPMQQEVPLKEVMGQFEPKTHKDFVRIEAKYADRNDRYMHREAYEAFKKMWQHAADDGIKLVIRSAVRNFDYQKGIWERKWARNRNKGSDQDIALKILQYSSMPGTSRHHWGTDIDFNAFENSYFEQGEGKKIYNWLQEHAGSYGYCQPYTKKGLNRPHGYNEEKWHWSYLPVALKYYQVAENKLRDQDIKGFSGSHTATAIGVVQKYVLGIAPACQQEQH